MFNGSVTRMALARTLRVHDGGRATRHSSPLPRPTRRHVTDTWEGRPSSSAERGKPRAEALHHPRSLRLDRRPADERDDAAPALLGRAAHPGDPTGVVGLPDPPDMFAGAAVQSEAMLMPAYQRAIGRRPRQASALMASATGWAARACPRRNRSNWPARPGSSSTRGAGAPGTICHAVWQPVIARTAPPRARTSLGP